MCIRDRYVNKTDDQILDYHEDWLGMEITQMCIRDRNGGILANQAGNAFDLIASCGKLQNQFLGKTSPLSEDSKSCLLYTSRCV